MDVIYSSVGSRIGVVDRRLYVFVRREQLSVAALDAIADHIRDRKGQTVGLLAVVPGDAGLSDNTVLDRQRRMMAEFFADPLFFVGFVVLGTSVQAILMRSVVRLAFVGKRNASLTANTVDGARFLAPRLQLSQDAIVAAVDELTREVDRS